MPCSAFRISCFRFRICESALGLSWIGVKGSGVGFRVSGFESFCAPQSAAPANAQARRGESVSGSTARQPQKVFRASSPGLRMSRRESRADSLSPHKALRGGIPYPYLEPLTRTWSRFVGIYRQKSTKSYKNDF